MEEPLFEVVCGELKYRIWEDGRISGFPGGAKVISRYNLRDREIIRQGAQESNEYFRKHGRVR